MAEQLSNTKKSGGVRLFQIALAFVLIAGAGLGAFLYLKPGASVQENSQNSAPSGPLQAFAVGPLARLKSSAPTPPPAFSFKDGKGRAVNLSAFKGKLVLLNFWATWCAPCTTEMPTLAALQRRFPAAVAVTPVSVDMDNKADNAKSFIGVHEPLPFFIDPDMSLPSLLGVKDGLPTTILFDQNGREVARLTGEADWSSPEAVRLIEKLTGVKAIN